MFFEGASTLIPVDLEIMVLCRELNCSREWLILQPRAFVEEQMQIIAVRDAMKNRRRNHG